MTEPRWSDGDDRRSPQRGGPGTYRRPDPGAYDRGDASPWGGGSYRHDPSYRDDRDAFEDDDELGELYRPRSAAGRAPRRWGALPGRTGVFIVIASAALGALITAVTGSQPGLVLGVLLVGGTITAALAVRPRAGYLVIPVPALAGIVAASLAGLVSDRAAGTSRTALAINGAQWIAGVFIAMTVATGLAIVITLVRWYTSRRAQRDPGRPGRRGRGARGPRSRPAPSRHGPGGAAEGSRRSPAPGSRSAQRDL